MYRDYLLVYSVIAVRLFLYRMLFLHTLNSELDITYKDFLAKNIFCIIKFEVLLCQKFILKSMVIIQYMKTLR